MTTRSQTQPSYRRATILHTLPPPPIPHGPKLPQPTPAHPRPKHPNPAHPSIPKITVQTTPLATEIERVYHTSIPARKSPIKGNRASPGTATEATRCLMPKNARKATRSQHSRRTYEPSPSQPAQPERQETAGNDRDSDFSSLSRRQQSPIVVAAVSSSIAQVVRSLAPTAPRSAIGGFARKRSEIIGLF